MDILKKLASVLRGGKPASEKTKATTAPMTAAPDQSLSGRLLTAIGHPPERKYRVLVNLGGGEHEVRMMNSEQALNYLNRGGAWHRIA